MRNKEYKIMLAVMVAVSSVSSIVVFLINTVCGIICTLLSAVLIGVFVFYTEKRYKQISQLNNYLALVCSGDYSLDIDSNAEGELSILKNYLYKVVVMLQSSNEALKNDKVYLADSLADISHQLKTPLTSMMVMTDLIKDEQNSDKRLEFVGIIESQLDKMRWLVSTLLKLSKLDAGTADFHKTELKIADVIEESLKPFLLSLELKNIKVDKQIENYTFVGDKKWSTEAIQNIIKNCIEHTQGGGTLRIRAADSNVYSELVIKDDGCGIAPEDLPHIFERFYHGKNSSDDSVGIGLALSKEILSKEKATLDAKSEVGSGTEFNIRFYKTIV